MVIAFGVKPVAKLVVKSHPFITGVGVAAGMLNVKFVNPTAQPSFGLIGLFGGPNVTEVKLYATGGVVGGKPLSCGVGGVGGKPGNCGAGTKFHV